MLEELRVENLGVIADLHLVVAGGMTVITGETGAGKTLLVEAIELLVGGRADAALVRPGADAARVEARFSFAPGALDGLEIEALDDADGEVVVSRVVPVNGRSRAAVNGRMVPVGVLADLGSRLVDLHGQHDHQSLLAPAVQRAALDRFAGSEAADALGAYRAARAARRTIVEHLGALGGDHRARAREIDLLRFQAAEIDAVAPTGVDEDQRLALEVEVLADAEALRDAAGRSGSALVGPDGARDAIGAAIAALAGRSTFADLAERLHTLQEEAADVAAELRHRADAISDDPERLAQAQERRRALAELRRKYGDDLASVLVYRSEIGARLDELVGWEQRAAALEHELLDNAQAIETAARALSSLRRASAVRLGPAVSAHLRDLAMPRATFEVTVDDGEPGDDGADSVTFLLSANAGEPALPLAKVASGGELARCMLAARRVLSEAPPTLVFDEVDAGIGGEAGVAIGRTLAALATDHQVLCVTHLAQVAVWADQQVVATKLEVDGRTISQASPVTGTDRVAEVARMLSGAPSDSARKHARELLQTASRERTNARAG